MTFSWADLQALVPELVLCLVAMVLLLVEPVLRRPRSGASWFALAGLVAAGYFTLAGVAPSGEFFGGSLVIDGFTNYFRAVAFLAGILGTIFGIFFLQSLGEDRSEYYAILLFAVTGVTLSAAARDLVVLFLGLEVLSISTYAMVGFVKANERCHEAVIKYFLLSSLSTAILLYGLSFLYGITGATQYAGVARGLAAAGPADPYMILAVVMVLAGIGFKLSVAPFHMYVPDVYQGAPTSTTAFLSVAPKLAGFAALLRLSAELRLADAGVNWVPAMWVLAALTMVLGNVIAVYQDNVKRMLAYSSIAHAGYLFMGVAVASADVPDEVRRAAVSAILFYLFAYVFMKMGAFAMVSSVLFGKRFGEYLTEFRGLGRRCPRVGLAYLILLVSLAGIPPTVGFVGKLQLFAAVIRAEFYWLAVIAALTSAIGLFYYLRVVVVMYFREDPAAPGIIASLPLKAMIGLTTAAVIVLGIFPALVLQSVISSVAALY